MIKSRPGLASASGEAPRATLVWGLSPGQAAILGGIVVATLLIYMPSLRNGWVLDDRQEFVDNKLIHSWSFVWNSFRYDAWWFRNPARLPQSPYYRPLEDAWFAANALLFGQRPALWHLAKIGVHVVAVVLSYRVAQLISGKVEAGLLTAAIFAVMPAQAGGVAYASAIPEQLATVFELGAMALVIGRQPGWSRGSIGALILYAFAMLTHESAILFPLIVAAYIFIFERGERGRRARLALRGCAPFAVVAIAYLFARSNVPGLGLASSAHFEASGTAFMRGFEVSRPEYSPIQILMTIPEVLIIYLGVLALPAMAGPTHAVDWMTAPRPLVFVSGAALMALAGLAWMLARRSSNRGIYLFCAVWSVLTIAPALNLNALWWLVDDRYLYAPAFGWSLAVAVTALQMAAASSSARKAVGLATATMLALYAMSTMQTERYWHDDVTFFRRCVEIAPQFPSYRLQLAAAMNKAGDFDGAAQTLEQGTVLDPSDAHLQLKLAQQYQMMGRPLDFEREFQKFNALSAEMAARRQSATP